MITTAMPLYWIVRRRKQPTNQIKIPDAFLIEKHPETKILQTVVQSRIKYIKINIKLSTIIQQKKITQGKMELKKYNGKKQQKIIRVENIVKGKKIISFNVFYC